MFRHTHPSRPDLKPGRKDSYGNETKALDDDHLIRPLFEYVADHEGGQARPGTQAGRIGVMWWHKCVMEWQAFYGPLPARVTCSACGDSVVLREV